MMDAITAFASVFIALIAVAATIWQARRSARLAEDALALPVAAETFREFRSQTFREHARRLLTVPGEELNQASGFHELSPEFQESAYHICYYFEYIGVLTAHGLVRKEVVIGTMSTQIMEVWEKMAPCIIAERQFRRENLPQDAGVEFLPHYENLVRQIAVLGGRSAGMRIRKGLDGWCADGSARRARTE
ncbi:DUF4760 domain-containing protein [Streptomyces zaehneri]|uniref:DUF4760 domain-containing protein n=1 Tax=Streptomyces zaehneri TaxID=3051180 RepID=UPI0028D40B67|nr:hypothetical protein [Streptomyces sp. DSM 40713]